MLLELARQYADIIQAIEVERFRSVDASYEFRALITLHDGSQLFVKDYLFVDGTRKYAYHWPDVTSYPHHQHVGLEEVVTTSDIRTPAEALQYIREQSKDS